MTLPITQSRIPRNLRYRRLHFPGADAVAFDMARKVFMPVPNQFSKLIQNLSALGFRASRLSHLHGHYLGSRKRVSEHAQHNGDFVVFSLFIRSPTNSTIVPRCSLLPAVMRREGAFRVLW
jgi:hypothetical protein